MSDIKVGDTWVSKSNRIKIARVGDFTVSYCYLDTPDRVYDSSISVLFDFFEPKHADPVIAVDSVWRHKTDGELVYIESDDGEDLPYNINFSPLGETDVYADDTKGFLSQYEFVCDSKYDSSLVFEGYRFVGRGEGNHNATSEKGTSLLGVKHGHYHKDVSKYKTMDIYDICDLYVKDNSGCIQHAVKKLLCCGERGVKDNVKDLQEAIDTIQRKIEMLQGQGEGGK